ncbi:MAG: CPBP family intramembrane metalloprotease [Spirochaetales bacterium]|nr:CPBP family intramembrane metalloprotease [Spirochaetales bacterium]
MTTTNKNLLLFLELFALGIVLYLPDALLPLFLDSSDLFNNGKTMMVYSVIFAIELGIILYYLLGIKKERAQSLGIHRPSWSDLGRCILLLFTIFTIYFALIILANLLPPDLLAQMTQGHSWSLGNIALAPIVLLFCFFIGLKEELFFRAICIGRLKEWGLPAWAAILLSALIFSSLHLYEGLLAGIFAFASALIFGAFYEKWKNVFVLACAHGLFNFSILILSYFFREQIL